MNKTLLIIFMLATLAESKDKRELMVETKNDKIYLVEVENKQENEKAVKRKKTGEDYEWNYGYGGHDSYEED